MAFIESSKNRVWTLPPDIRDLIPLDHICYFSTSPTGSENHLSHYDFKHLTEKYFEIGMRLIDFSIQLVKYCIHRE